MFLEEETVHQSQGLVTGQAGTRAGFYNRVVTGKTVQVPWNIRGRRLTKNAVKLSGDTDLVTEWTVLLKSL